MSEASASQPVRLQLAGVELRLDLARAHSLAIEQLFDGTQPRFFGADAARSEPLRSGTFTGRVAAGASCNCATLHLTPHCNGTHTECVGHLTAEPLDALHVVPAGLLPALLVSVTPQRAADSGEGSDPAPQPDDALITRTALRAAWPAQLPFSPRALLIRTLPNDAGKRCRDYTQAPAAFLSREAAQLLVERGIEHLLLDVPSADRGEDQGRLCAHRIFFGLPPGSARLADARRAQCTITELAFIDDTLADGAWLMALQVPALAGDALPSRPLLYAVATS